VIAENEICPQYLRRGRRLRAMSPGGCQSRNALVRESAAIDLLQQSSAAVADDDAGDGLQKDAIFE